jgi:hypothetical protein
MHTDIRALIRIRIHDPSVQAREDGSCLRLHDHSDRLILYIVPGYVTVQRLLFLKWVGNLHQFGYDLQGIV